LTSPGGIGMARIGEAALSPVRDRRRDALLAKLSAIEDCSLVGPR
jgi:hypothetical protein